MTDMTKITPSKISLKWKVIAWWKGYDVADLEQKRQVPTPPPQIGEKPIVKTDDEKPIWSDERIKITQLIWGEGFCGPGGVQNIIHMSKLLALSPKMSAAVIGAGLGGPSRVLAKKFGVWVNGYESSPHLAHEGMKISIAKGLEKKAPIAHLDLNDPLIFERSFDRAFSKETLYTIKNKAAAMTSIYHQLKDDGLFLFTDFVLNDHYSHTHPDVYDWIENEPLHPFPTTSDDMISLLEESSFSIRIQEEITDQYMDMVNEAWAKAEELALLLSEDGESGRSNMFAILKEAELWNRRIKALRSGELKLYRYLAHKTSQQTQ